MQNHVNLQKRINFMTNQTLNQEKDMNKLLKRVSDEYSNSHFYVCCSPSFAEGLVLTKNQEVITSYNDYLTMLN